jgi:hypothetical protein
MDRPPPQLSVTLALSGYGLGQLQSMSWMPLL